MHAAIDPSDSNSEKSHDLAQAIETLQEFLIVDGKLQQAQKSGANVDTLQSKLEDLHKQLLQSGRSLIDPETIVPIEELEFRAALAKALLLLPQIKANLAAPEDILDTAGSKTITFYRTDFLSDVYLDRVENAAVPETLQSMCRKRLRIPAERMEQIISESRAALSGVRFKRQIVSALREGFGLFEDNPKLASGVRNFFESLYPATGIAEEEVKIIVTSSMIFLALPFPEKGTELTTKRFQALTPEEQKPIHEFLKRLNKFTQQQFADFPTFGFLNVDVVDSGVLDRVAVKCGVSAKEVRQQLKSLITVLPLTEIDKYVVHDVWGHGWQASLLGFASMYRGLADFSDPLDLAEKAQCPKFGEYRFVECFEGAGADLALNKEHFRTFIDAEVGERIPVALTPAFAELMADVIEFKFLENNPHKKDLMPSSSTFKDFPSKLDLTLRDIPYYFQQSTKVFRLWAKKEKRQERTVMQLVRLGASERAARTAVQNAVEVWNDLTIFEYSPKLMSRIDSKGTQQTNLLGRLMLNFTSMHAAVVDACRRSETVSTGDLPLRGFKELMVLSASVFFESDRSANLWHIDEFLSEKFLPLCEKLSGDHASDVEGVSERRSR